MVKNQPSSHPTVPARIPWESVSGSVLSDSLWPLGLQPARLLCPWHSPGNNTGVGCHALLQGIFLTPGLNLGLRHCRQILYHLSHQGSTPCPGMCTQVLFNCPKIFSFSLRKIPRMRVEISQYSSTELKAPWSLMVL